MAMNSQELLNAVITVPEAVTQLGLEIQTGTIRKAIRLGQLPARKADLGPMSQGVWLVVASDVLALWPHGARRRPGRKLTAAPAPGEVCR